MDTPPFTISGLPDETLDSAMARTFKLYAFGSWRHVYEELCGIPGRLPLNGIPGRLDDLATFLGYPLTGMEVLRSLTLWNGFSAFMPAEERARYADKIRAALNAHLHPALGPNLVSIGERAYIFRTIQTCKIGL